MTTDRVMPHSLEAERAVLGAVLVSDAARFVAFAALGPGDFYRDAHGLIFLSMMILAKEGVAVDLVTLLAELRKSSHLDDVGGPAYIASLADGVPRSANVEHYAAIVKQHAKMRAAIRVGSELVASAYESSERAETLIDRSVADLMREIGTSKTRPVDAYAASVEFSDGLDAEKSMVPTGYADVDGLLGGLPLGNLTVIAARPSVGKTTMSLGIAAHVAAQGRGVAYFSLEMRRSELGARVASWRSRVPTPTLERGLATEEQYLRFSVAQQSLDGVPLFIDDTSMTLAEIDAWCRRLRDERGDLALAVIDYLQLLIPAGTHRQASRQEQVAEISRGLKRLGKDLRIAVVALSQLSRAPESRSDKRPHLADLRESGALEQDADLAMLLFRQEMHKRTEENHGVAECIVAKNRTGPVGVVRLCFNETLAQFANLAQF